MAPLAISSCSSGKGVAEAKARHQAGSGDRINQSQKNSEGLFKDIE